MVVFELGSADADPSVVSEPGGDCVPEIEDMFRATLVAHKVII